MLSHNQNKSTFALLRRVRGFLSRSLALLCIGLLPLGAQAQPAATGEVQGRVLDINNGKYLGNARVVVQGTLMETSTNEFGEYHLIGVPAGPASLQVVFADTRTAPTAVTIVAGQVISQDLKYTPGDADSEYVMLDAFVVVSRRERDGTAMAVNEQRNSANLKNVVSTDAYGEISQGNIGEFMKHVPGVTVEYNGNSASGIQVRGFNSNYTTVTLDGGMLASSGSSLNSQNHTRQYTLDQTSINNLSRIEITKLPTPDMAANVMGGSVNLVSKSAFEYARPEVRLSAYLSMNSSAMNLGKTAGPGEDSTYKLRPSADFSFIKPINDKFGMVIAASSANQFYRQQNSTITRNFSTNTTSDNPMTTGFKVTDSPSMSDRSSASMKFDWKPSKGHVVSLSLAGSSTSGESTGRTVSYSTGNTATSWGETFTESGTGGSMSQSVSFKETGGTSLQGVLSYRFTGAVWQVDAAANVSTSRTWQRDTDRGGFGTVSTSTDVRRVSFTGIDNDNGSPGTISTAATSGDAIDPSDPANYRVTSVSGNSTDAKDIVTEGRVNVSRLMDMLPFYLKVKAGASTNSLRREIDYTSSEWTYVGANGVANDADNSLAALCDESYTRNPGLGYPSINYASTWRIYSLYRDHPEYFTRSAAQISNTLKSEAVRSPLMKETVSAGYLMADSKFLENRVRLVGGARYELTEDEGWGYLQNSAGYVRRGTHVSRDYDGIYPSAHMTVTALEDLQVRVGYAKTMGRPRISDIVPNLYVGANTGYDPSNPSSALGWVTSSNTTLKPWTANNYDISVEYYLPKNGVVSAGVFRKEIQDFFGSLTKTVDAALAAELGISEETIGYTYSTRINTGAARIDGIELSYSQNLTNNIGVFANFTRLDLDGNRQADFTDFVPKTGNIGLRASYWKLFGMVKLNYRGKQLREYKNSTFTGAAEYIRAYTTVDANIEYQMTKHFSLFVAGRNITNQSYEWEVSGSGAPSWSALTSFYKYGAQYSAGVKASF